MLIGMATQIPTAPRKCQKGMTINISPTANLDNHTSTQTKSHIPKDQKHIVLHPSLYTRQKIRQCGK